ncbi:hypothetical protein ABUE31_10720 [Mesorhizobium sp. ZMM04-5]|uniref:Helicase ATP-binding domain-containing protein n=2 Tax=Mesorhizobium marinum TaxID=3228790 RepID=A0ABV3R0N3_9HYPH
MQTTFTDRMNRHWTQTLGLASSEAHIEGWQQLEQATIRLNSNPGHWQVYQLPTGSGKTEALKVLCSLQHPITHPGILIVTKFQDEADRIARDINRLAGWNMARSVHRKAPAQGAELGLVPALVTTHAAYRLALQELADNCEQSPKWDRLLTYYVGKRRWVFIDEALDWVDAYSVNLGNLRALSGDLCGALPTELRTIARRLQTFAIGLADVGPECLSDRTLNKEQLSVLEPTDLSRLREAVEKIPEHVFAEWVDADQKPDQRTDRKPVSYKASYLDLLRTLHAVANIGHGWISYRKGKALLHSSRSLLGIDGIQGIILDATADVDPAYALMPRHVELLPRPQGIRNYSNATLHVSYGHAVGKRYLTNHAAKAWPFIWGDLQKRLNGKNVLVCAHKDVLPIVSGYALRNGHVQFANWGKLDGKNDWNACDALVLFGLPYLDDIAPVHSFIAQVGPQPDDWFAGVRNYGGHHDICSALGTGFIARSVVQAINRIRCRNSIDIQGNCSPVDLYMLLPKGKIAEVVLRAIGQQMPRIRIKQWEAGAAKRKALKVPTEDKLTRYLADADPGIYTKAAVLAELGMHPASLDRLTAKLRDCRSPLTQKLTSLAVQYLYQTGRGREACFIKD